jgi:hemolysin III
MAETTRKSHDDHEHFSVTLFILTVVGTLGLSFLLVSQCAPAVWAREISAPLWKGVVVFVSVNLLNCFVEYFFHRYILHTPAIPFFRYFYRQHTLHHALTRIGSRVGADHRTSLVIENKFPILEPEQGEASFFPWYSLFIFSLILTPVLGAMAWVLPSFPWLLAGYVSLAGSLCIYEISHAISHLPFSFWEPLMRRRYTGSFWRLLYSFHLRHHAVIDCNESISGFFGLPIADWVFGTCVVPETLFENGEHASQGKFTSPRPRALIRWLDRLAAHSVSRRRERVKTHRPDAKHAPHAVASGVNRHVHRKHP